MTVLSMVGFPQKCAIIFEENIRKNEEKKKKKKKKKKKRKGNIRCFIYVTF